MRQGDLKKGEVTYQLRNLLVFFELVVWSFLIGVLPFIVAQLCTVYIVIRVAQVEFEQGLASMDSSSSALVPFSWPSCENVLQEPSSGESWRSK